MSVGDVSGQRVDKLVACVVDVGGSQLCGAEQIIDGAFGDSQRIVGVDRLLVVDRCDVNVHRAKVLVRAAAGARIAVIVDDHVDGVSIVAKRVCRTVQVGHVAGRVQIGIQVRLRTGQRQRGARSADRDAGAGDCRKVASGRCRQRDGQVTARSVDVRKINRRQIDVAGNVFGDRHIAGQATHVGGIVIHCTHIDRNRVRIRRRISVG